MENVVNQLMTGLTETVSPLVKQVAGQLEDVKDMVSLSPSDSEVAEALGPAASSSEREAYRLGHRSGWYKGAFMFGCAILAGLAVLTFATSGEEKKA